MKKSLSACVIAFVWTAIMAFIVVSDYTNWSNERQTSAYQGGCAGADRLYLIENMEDEGILYVMDVGGDIQDVTKSSDIWEGSSFVKAVYTEGIYVVLAKTAMKDDAFVTEYRIVSLDEDGKALAKTSVFQMAKEGILSGFTVDEAGFYLTLVMNSGGEAGAFFVERENLLELSGGEQEETEERPVLEVNLHELTVCEEGRLIIEARYEAEQFLLCKDDGSGRENFKDDEDLQKAFRERNLTTKQWMKVHADDLTFYLQLFLVGFVALALLSLTLRNRSHTVYTIAIVELVLLALTLAGAIQAIRIQEQTREEEVRRFGYYYIQTLVEEIGAFGQPDFDGEDFYNQNEYYVFRNLLSRFVNMDEVSNVFMDICLVRREDHQILVSASGYNRQRFEEVYAADTDGFLQNMEKGDQKISMTMRVEGSRYQVLGTAVAVPSKLYPEYFLIGITRQEDALVISDGIPKNYLIYAEMMFLLGSMVSIVLLFLQDRELRRLARAIHAVAGGETQLFKGTVYGKDVNLMWNSLMEIDKIISRINYTKYKIYESCYRFAPKNIEKILGKDSITEVKGGDMVMMEGTIAILSSAEPEGLGDNTAEKMNQFITRFEKYQEESEGFFISGQCDLAMMKLLFLEEARNTVESGAAFIHEFYEEKSLSELKTSIFLHYSQFTYGVAGTGNQSFPFLLSAEDREMERYGAWFRQIGLRLVITESVKRREGLKTENLRYIGYIRISKVPGQIRLYEVLDACSYHEKYLKKVTNAKFQNGIELFYRHDFYLARNVFSDVLKENPEDYIAKWYLFICERYLNEAFTEGDICRLRRED